MRKEIKNWEKEFDKKWYLWDYSKKLETYNTCGEEVKSFIHQLLEQEKQKWMNEIENLMKKYGHPEEDNVGVDVLRELKQRIKNGRNIGHIKLLCEAVNNEL